jgi:hypothetical protein
VWLNESTLDAAGRIQLRSCGLELGCALDANGIAQASMGVACGDIDNDGLLDLGVSNYYYEHYTLYRSQAAKGFEDVSVPCQIAATTRATMGWGTEFIDCDNDGWLDLFIANGHINRSSNGTTPYEILPQLFRNSKRGKFIDVGQTAGPYFRTPCVGRGAAFGDYDNDGLEDIAVVHHHRAAALLHNETPTNHSAIVLKLIGRSSSRDAMNARVFATIRSDSGNLPSELVREITPGTSYLWANDYRVRIGIGTATQADIRVQWPSGREETWHNLKSGATRVLREMVDELSELP